MTVDCTMNITLTVFCSIPHKSINYKNDRVFTFPHILTELVEKCRGVVRLTALVGKERNIYYFSSIFYIYIFPQFFFTCSSIWFSR